MGGETFANEQKPTRTSREAKLEVNEGSDTDDDEVSLVVGYFRVLGF